MSTDANPSCPRCGAETPPGARFCPSCGHPLTDRPLRLDERKLVTVLFADVTGSTALGERLDPERLQAILADYFATMEVAIESWGGRVEKFVGDAIMAAFGVPVVRENDAERALHAALEILARLELLNERFQKLHGVRLNLRVGVNTGEVIAPTSERVEQLIVAGDAVNVAARLEAAAEPGTILVGERTVTAVRGGFLFGEDQALALKGKSEPVKARQLLGFRPGYERENPDLRARLVGRERELAVLGALLSEIETRAEPRMAIIYGPAGIGKTRLTRELVAMASGGAEPPTVVRGRCLAVGNGVTYWALSEILREHCQIGLGDNASEAHRKLTRCVGKVTAGLGLSAAEIEETVAALATTAGIGSGEPGLRGLEPKAVAEALGRAWPRFLTGVAMERPTVAVIEDLHWAGDQLVELLQRILTRSQGPLLVLATARPEFSQRAARLTVAREGVTTIELAPLTKEESGQLITELLPSSDLPAEFSAAILDKAEGNPFFLEEIVARLMEEGVLAREESGFRVIGDPTRIRLPDSIQTVLAARIDALTPEEKLVLQEAAVVGRVFWPPPLRRRLPDADVEAALLGLEGRGLVSVRSQSTIPGETEYKFRHALVRDVAYAGLPRSRRALAHAGVAAWTEEVAADRRDEFGEVVAHHYWTAVTGAEADLAWADNPDQQEKLRTKAFTTLVEAGTAARRRYALSRAVELHQHALDLAREPSEQVEALQALGDDHAAAYHGDETVSYYQAALDLARREPGLADRRAPLTVRLVRESVMKSGTFHEWKRPEEVESWIEEGLASEPDPFTRAWLHAFKGGASHLWTEYDEGDPVPIDQRIALAKEGYEWARHHGSAGQQVYASEVLMQLYEADRRYELCLQLARDRLALADGISAPSTLLSLLFESANAIGEIGGEWSECESLARRALEIGVTLSPHEYLHATGCLLTALYNLGRWEEAEKVVSDHLAAFAEESNVSCLMVRTGPALGALMAAQQGDAERAYQLLDLIPQLSRRSGFIDGCRALTRVVLGEVDLGIAQAEDLLGRSLLRHRRFAHVARLEGRRAKSDWVRLRQDLESVGPDLAGSVGLRVAVQKLAGQMEAAAGNAAIARLQLEDALDLARRHQMSYEAKLVEDLLTAVS